MPISEPYNPLNDPALNPRASKRQSNNQILFKRFVTPQGTVTGAGNGVTSLDDPTYLGFSLRFDILSPLFNGATNSTPEKPPVNLTDPIGSPFFAANQKAAPSAVGYLLQVGEKTRATYLKSFIQGLIEINSQRPYYWQTIEGLSDAWAKSNSMKDPYTGSAEGEGIAIGCLEAIDLKISAIFNLYRGAVLDNRYNRYILPRNLMYFDVYVDIYEIRNFKSSMSWLDKIASAKNQTGLPQTDVDRFLNDNTSKMTFKFSECVWNVEETGKIFEKVTNAGGNEMASTSMKWSYSQIEMESEFAGYDQTIADDDTKQPKGSLGDFVKDATKDAVQNAANSALERLRQAASARVQGLALGNVYGFRNRAFAALQNPGALAAAVAGAGQLIGNLFGPRQQGPRLGDNPLGEPRPIPSSLPADNLFPNEASGFGELDSTNIFGPGPSGPPPLNSTNVFG